MTSAPPCSLNFIVVGGSIAGLISAYQLCRAGHKVLVLEKDPPNAVVRAPRIEQLIALLTLSAVPRRLASSTERDAAARDYTGHDGLHAEQGHEFTRVWTSFHVLGRLSYDPQCVTDLLVNFWAIPYDTFLDHLTALCKDAGVHIVYHVPVASIIPGDRPVVVTAAGQSFSADIIVGADGRFSVTRDYVNQDPELCADEEGEEEEEEEDTVSLYSAYRPMSAFPPIHATRGWTFCISTQRMRNDPSLEPLWQDNLIGWPGTGIVVLAHPCGPELFIMTAVRLCDLSEPVVDGHFQLNQPYEDFNKYLKQFDPRLRRLAKIAHTVHTTTQSVPRFTRFADPKAHVVLIGDAAHGSPIHCTHHCALAIEDAFTLANIFSRARMARVAAVEASEFESIHQVMLPPGPQRESRDASLATTLLIDEDEQTMSDEDFGGMAYWWINYGRYALEQEYGVPVNAGEGGAGGVGGPASTSELNTAQARVVAQLA
ncbi:hypothetical protein BD626DRAFT_506438 [Schizophyllum amplum]|uniref:FAD-binding domain-containing protein n=1 Tax=Schizophyllum amplum TaxID=97359 RepID=A0A550C5L5_9AGAR|nr:hypothetical protein BD626DRAFT_506438 [Auriculariopsis ampla]